MKLMLMGDLVPTKATMPTFDQGNTKELMGAALEEILQADAAVANLECALTNSEKPIRKCGPNLKGKPEYARVIKDCGIGYCGLCNNHVMDFGIEGMRETIAALREAGVVDFGWGENDALSRQPLFIEGEKRVGIVAVCEHEYSYALPDQMGSNPFDPFETMLDITKAKEACDYLIVMYHGGKEQCQVPSPRLRGACRAMARAGADLILCQHSHCVGCRENYEGTEIVYGQGNFNFVKYIDHPHWHSGLMIRLTLEEKASIEYIPIVAAEAGIDLPDEQEKKEILDGFFARSEMIQNRAKWMEAWEAFCQSMKNNYTGAVKRAYGEIPEGEECHQVFPHYLDCEAHLDVWKTLYQTWHARKTAGA